jgi:ubiquinone/menaquinone biosynthesis C-methylase UbiE
MCDVLRRSATECILPDLSKPRDHVAETATALLPAADTVGLRRSRHRFVPYPWIFRLGWLGHLRSDVASGTGDIVLRVLDCRETRHSRHVLASDISRQMLSVAERRLARLGYTVELRCQDSHSLSGVAANSVDLYSISLGLKICDRSVVLREALRVLRPGGRLVILEASNIPFRWLQAAYIHYMSMCMPLIGWIVTGGDASAYRYLLQGIRDFPTAELGR